MHKGGASLMLYMATVLLFLVCPKVTGNGSDCNSLLWYMDSALSGNANMLVGDHLRLTCNVETRCKNYTARNISFGLTPDIISYVGDKTRATSRLPTRECVAMELVHVKNESTAEMVVPTVSLYDAGEYACYVGNLTCETKDDAHSNDFYIVGVLDVTVEYPPYNVTNLRCINTNWFESMTCTWDHPVHYVNQNNVNVSLIFNFIYTSYRRCPNLTFNSCKWNEEDLYDSMTLVMEVNVSNTVVNATASKVFSLSTYDIVQPGPVDSFEVEPIANRPDCFRLSWNHSKIHRTKVYRLKHKSADNQSSYSILIEAVMETNYETCGYKPMTHHYFSVEVFPTGIFSGIWSTPVFSDGWTPQTAPSLGPSALNGSYHTPDQSCVGGQSNVTLMWQEVEEWAKNGIIERYVLRHLGKVIANVSADQFSTTVKLPCDEHSMVKVYALNGAGESLVPTLLSIAPKFRVPACVEESFAIEVISQGSNSSGVGETLLRAVWNMKEKDKALNYTLTIFWCDGWQVQKCRGPVNWIEVATNETYSEYADLPNLMSDVKNFLFGISVKDEHQGLASRIHWTKCLYRPTLSIMARLKTCFVKGG